MYVFACSSWLHSQPWIIFFSWRVFKEGPCILSLAKGSDLSYRDRLIKLRLLPVNYWLEYLDLVFFYKCLNNLVDFNFDFDHYFSFVQECMHCANTAHCLKTNYAHTSLFWDNFFNRIMNEKRTLSEIENYFMNSSKTKVSEEQFSFYVEQLELPCLTHEMTLKADGLLTYKGCKEV